MLLPPILLRPILCQRAEADTKNPDTIHQHKTQRAI